MTTRSRLAAALTAEIQSMTALRSRIGELSAEDVAKAWVELAGKQAARAGQSEKKSKPPRRRSIYRERIEHPARARRERMSEDRILKAWLALFLVNAELARFDEQHRLADCLDEAVAKLKQLCALDPAVRARVSVTTFAVQHQPSETSGQPEPRSRAA